MNSDSRESSSNGNSGSGGGTGGPGPGPSLGEFLRGERERRGITIEQVASATKIGVKLLHSLEGDQFGDLPAKPFIRGFVTSYARFIGLNPGEVLTRYSDYIDRKSTERPARDAGHSGYAFERREGDNSRAMLWMILGKMGVVGGLALLFVKPGNRHGTHMDKLKKGHTAQVQVSPTPSASVSPATSSSPEPVPTGSPGVAAVVAAATTTTTTIATTTTIPVPSPSASPTADEADPLNSGVRLKPSQIKHKLILKAIADVRIRYQVDQRSVMTFVLRKDRILVLRAEKEVRLQATRTSDLVMNYNSSGEKPLEGNKYVTTRQGDPTVIFPVQLAESLQEPFPGTRPLSGR